MHQLHRILQRLAVKMPYFPEQTAMFRVPHRTLNVWSKQKRLRRLRRSLFSFSSGLAALYVRDTTVSRTAILLPLP